MTLVRLLSLTLCFVAFEASAQTLYVSDELVITLRTGPSTQNAVVRSLRSGDAVTVLEENDDGSYARVRVQGVDEEGWVLTQYLVPERSSRERLVVAERDLAGARSRIGDLEAELEAMTTDLEETRSSLAETESANTEIGAELADIRRASASAIELRDRNEALGRRVTELQADLERATMENIELASRSRQNWFVVGAAVLLGGIVIGLIAPSLRRRRTSSW